VERRKVSCPFRELNVGRPAGNPSLYPLHYIDSTSVTRPLKMIQTENMTGFCAGLLYRIWLISSGSLGADTCGRTDGQEEINRWF
jgi:hypothetical protein